MLKGRDDVDRVIEIARRYNVRVFLSGRFPHGFGEHTHEVGGRDTRGLQVTSATQYMTDGPVWHFCDVRERIVWFDNLDSSCAETHLHEVCHCIMQPPGGDIDRLSEDVVLMPFERTIARQCLSPEGYRKVIQWQEVTQIEWWDARKRAYYSTLEDAPNYSRRGLWRESFEGLRRMGAIKSGRVTWKQPNWRRAPKKLLARGHHMI